MEFDPELWLRIKDKKVTAHQMQILSELAVTRSQTAAAAKLKISVPVLHRHLKSLERKFDLTLVTSTPNGTWLTRSGRTILKLYHRYQEMLQPESGTMLCCSPITMELLSETLSDFESSGKRFHISISSDEQNLKALYLGRADLVIFDDPNFAIEFEGSPEDKILIEDIYSDTLIHIDNGPKYIRFKYGAQRLGFRYLDAEQKKYKILYEVSNYKHLVSGKKSFFINRSFAERNNLDLMGTTDPNIFIHPLMAVSINPTEELRELVDALKAQAGSEK
jgi:molybdenum-dependent DNA-binding transcriptional regulator ModE